MKFFKQGIPRTQLIVAALLIGTIGTYLIVNSRAAVSCDQTVSSVSAAQTAVSSASPGDTVCLSDGTYGRVNLNATKAKPGVILQAQNPGQASIAGANMAGTNLTIAQFKMLGSADVGVGSTGMTIDHNFFDLDNYNGYGVVACASSSTTCNDVTITNNKFIGRPDEDQIRANRYHDSDGDGYGLRIEQNEFAGNTERGDHNDVFQSVWVGDHLVFRKNYLHDFGGQGFFVKDQATPIDGLIADDNLIINQNLPCEPASLCSGFQLSPFQVYGPVSNVSMQHNTVGFNSAGNGDGGTAVLTGTYTNANFSNSVFNSLALTNGAGSSPSISNGSNNTYCTSNSWPVPPGTTVNCHPSFINAAAGDFRQSNGNGVTWKVGDYIYGPTSDGTTPPPGDTTAPTVSITAPTASATVSGSSTAVSATATDNVGVSGVQFKLDGNNLGSEDTSGTSNSYSTTWNTTTATNGTHTLTAVARDVAGNTKTSSSVTVTVNNAAAGGKRYVATNGSDSGNNCLTQSSPCLTFSRAYNQATLGDTVEVAAGTYGSQTISYVNSSPKNDPTASLADVVFKPAAGAAVTVGTIEVEAFHVTVQDMTAQDTNIPYDGPVAVHDVTYKNMDARNFTIDSGVDINILGGDYGPSSACGGSYGGGNNGIRKNNSTMPSNILIDGVNIHDVQSYDLVACHIECLIIGAGDGLTIRDSKFRNCSIFDIFLQPFNGTISNVLIENNWFGQPTGTDGSTNSGRAVEFSTRSPWNANWTNVTVRNNSFNTALNVDDDTSSSYSTYTNFKVTGNILDRSGDTANTCNANVQYAYNVWKSAGCGSSTDIVAGGTFPYVNTSNGASFDYHLKPGSPGLNLVPANQAPANDIDGDARPQGSAADAGSDETAGGSTPVDSTNPTVSFTAPTNGSTVSGTVTATATASDNTGVSKVEISLDGSLKMTDTASPYSYSFDSKTLTNGSHTLSAKAYDAAGNTATTTITITVNNADTTPPSVPANLNATATTATTVNLTWNASTDTGTNASGVAKYNVLRNGVVIAQPTGTSYTDTTAVANTTYSYTVQAVDVANNVSASSTADSVTTPGVVDTTVPSVPGNVSGTAASLHQVNLSWNASTDTGGSGLAGYNVYRNGTKLNSSLLTSTSYGDSTVAADTTYSYRIEAVDGAGNKSAQSTAVSVKTPAVVRGDITGSAGVPDGKINLFDLSFVIRNYNTTNANGDISGQNGTPDGKIDLYDISYVIRNYQN